MPGCTRSTLLSNMRTQEHVQRHTYEPTHIGTGRVLKHNKRLHTSAQTQTIQSRGALCTWLQVDPSVSLSPPFTVLLSHANVHFSIWGIIIFDILQTLSHDGAIETACHFSLKPTTTPISQCARNERMVIDLPSFDVVQEGDVDVHQEWQQRYLWATGPQSALCQWKSLSNTVYSFWLVQLQNETLSSIKEVPIWIYCSMVLHFKCSPCNLMYQRKRMIHYWWIFPHRSRVEVFFLPPFLLWIYHLKKRTRFSVVILTFIYSFILQFSLSFVWYKAGFFKDRFRIGTSWWKYLAL